MLDKSVGSGQHSYAERLQDCYETPTAAVDALLKVERLPEWIWEPACGPGSISRALRVAGHFVISSDVHNYGQEFVLDFLDLEVDRGRLGCEGVDCIVTNPPYRFAQKFVEKSLKLCPKVVMLLRLAFLEGQRRSHILENAGLARVHVFRNRLPMMHRRGWDGKKASSAIPFAWFVWERGYTGPTIVDRISWERA